jgi:4-amino-4-deoxy-L-arabinose transferase-like glycosyltransferase
LSQSSRARGILLGIGVAVAAALLRLPNLRALPIFGDEAIFLRIARLVRADPSRNLWLPLNVPSAPLHPWLLALSLPIHPDPVTAGRLLSVACGALLVPALAVLVIRIQRFFSTDGGAAGAAIAAAVLTVISPFFVFSSRLARVDALFALEVAAVTILSLEVATRAQPGDSWIAPAVWLGFALGVTMLTRQAVAYVLWIVPVLAALLAGRAPLQRILPAIGLALVVGVLVWGPMILAPGWPDIPTRLFHIAASRPSVPLADRLTLFARNLGVATAAFWTYLTPPVALVAIAGTVALVRHRQVRLLGFLAAWELILLVPAALFAIDYFPRYALPAALPLLVAAAFGIASVISWSRPAGVILLAGLVAWGAVDVFRGERDWKSWPLLPVDRKQFVSGWSAGAASEAAAEFLESQSRRERISVVVPHVSGSPSDAVWLLLQGAHSAHLFYAVDFLHRPGRDVRGDVWLDEPETTLDAVGRVFFVSPDPVFLGRAGWAPAADVVPPLNPGARLVARFENPPDERGRTVSAVNVYRIR